MKERLKDMKNSSRELADQFDRKQRDLQDRILALPGSRRVLTKLIKQAANRAKVLSMLADAVCEVDSWRKPVRGSKKELESIANQLETVAKHAQRISLNPFCYSSFWLAVLGLGKWEMVKPPKELAPILIFDRMRLYAKNCRERAKAFGSLLREHPPRQKWAMIDCLLVEVRLQTGQYHDKEMAFLLTNAAEAARQKRIFTEDQIKKHRQKHVVPRIQAYQLLHPAKVSPEA